MRVVLEEVAHHHEHTLEQTQRVNANRGGHISPGWGRGVERCGEVGWVRGWGEEGEGVG